MKSMISGFVIMIAACLLSRPGFASGVNRNDTSIIARSDKSFTIDRETTHFQVTLQSTGKKVTGNRKIMLVLDDAKLKENPDGVYEVYVSLQPYDIGSLNSKKTSFASVLDLYSLTAIDASKNISLDITKNVSRWAKDGSPSPHLVVTIVFRGNKLADNSESNRAGKFSVDGIRVVQEN
jgi:hypothetical protein